MESLGLSEDWTFLALFRHPVADCDDMKVHVTQGLHLGRESMSADVVRPAIWKLRAISAVLDELLTSFGEMTTTGERVHIMKRPDDRLVLRQ